MNTPFANRLNTERLQRLGILEEPMGYVDGANLYEYVGSNPEVEVDPSGLAGERIVDPGNNVLKIPVDDGAGHRGEISVNSGVSVEYLEKLPDKMARKSQLLAMGYKGDKCDECTWVQFDWQEVIVSRGINNRQWKQGKVKTTSGEATLTTDPKSPIWHVDASPGDASPEYDGMSIRDKSSYTIYDQPDFNIPGSPLLADDLKGGDVTFVRSVKHFQTFLVCSGKVIAGFEWQQSNSWNPKDGPFGWRVDVPKGQKGDLRPSPDQLDVIRKGFPKQGVIKLESERNG